MSDVTIPGGKIRAFVERIENIDNELQELNEQKKEVFAEELSDPAAFARALAAASLEAGQDDGPARTP